MKNIVYFFSFMLAMTIMASCSKVDFEVPDDLGPQIDGTSLVLSTKSGYSSTSGTIYVPQDVATIFNLSSTGKKINLAFWEIEGSNYEGLSVSHKFSSLGEVVVKVRAEFQDGSKEERDFTVTSLFDISSADPVQVFSEKKDDGTWDVLFLFSKERLRYATSDNYFYNGLVVDWEKKAIPKDNSYIIDEEGKPKKTSDVGRYVGVVVNLEYKGLYNIALIHSETNWTDISGSKFVRSDNTGLAWFFFEDGEVIPQGDVEAANMPGKSGDNYFRFSQAVPSESRITLYFNLDQDLNSKAFVVQELPGGAYSTPMALQSVSGHSTWGQIELPASDLEGVISGFRYGPDKNKPSNYSENMKQSYYYSDYFKNLRLIIYKI